MCALCVLGGTGAMICISSVFCCKQPPKNNNPQYEVNQIHNPAHQQQYANQQMYAGQPVMYAGQPGQQPVVYAGQPVQQGMYAGQPGQQGMYAVPEQPAVPPPDTIVKSEEE